MKKSIFEHELAKAQTLYKHGKDEEKDFWRGYQTGIRRRYLGENFVPEGSHGKWLSLIHDEYHNEVGRGYRAGFYGPVRLTTDHPRAINGLPIFIDSDGRQMFFADGFSAIREWWGINGLSEAAGVSDRTAEGWCAGRIAGTDSLLRLLQCFE